MKRKYKSIVPTYAVLILFALIWILPLVVAFIKSFIVIYSDISDRFFW